MKNTMIAALIIVLGLGVYYFLNPNAQKEQIPSKQKEQNITLLDQDSDEVKRVIEKKAVINKPEDIGGKKTKIVTDSKVLKLLANSLSKSDWDVFDKVYDEQIMELRRSGDHSQFYEQFKNLFIDNNFPIADADGLLCLLTDTGTKESIHLLFEMFNDGTISNEEVQSRQSIYFLDSLRKILENPTIKVDKQALMLALKEEYRKTDNEHLKGKAAELIGWFDSTPQTQVTLFQDYMQEDDSAKKSAAKDGLMKLHGEALLPELHDNLRSDYKEVRQTAGMVLANMGTHKAVEMLVEWTIEDATVENAEELKEWYSKIMQRHGLYRVTKNIKLGKIQDAELRSELERFFDEALEHEKHREIK